MKDLANSEMADECRIWPHAHAYR